MALGIFTSLAVLAAAAYGVVVAVRSAHHPRVLTADGGTAMCCAEQSHRLRWSTTREMQGAERFAAEFDRGLPDPPGSARGLGLTQD